MSLCMLKDLLNESNSWLAKAVNENLLKLLFSIASSNQKIHVLKKYWKNASLEYSKKFYFLLLECFNKW